MAENNNLKSFITKLNDRNLQRKRESGITSYVLISVLIFCTYKLYKNLAFYFIYYVDFELTKILHLICFVSNSLVASYFIVSSFQTEKKPFSNLKTIKYDKRNFNLFGYTITVFLLVIPIISTCYSYLNKTEELNEYYYYYLGLLNFVSVLLLLEPIYSQKKELKINDTNNENIGLRIFIILISIMVIIFSISLALKVSINEKIIFIKIIVLFYIILYILEKIVEQEKNDINTFNLENFEYEIYLKNLDDEQIRERLQENYIGYLIDYWIDYNDRELYNFKKNFDTKKLEIKTSISTLESTVDKKKYPIEFEGRKKAIIENLNKEIEIKRPIFEKTLAEIAKIIKDGNNLNESELGQLKQLQEDLSSTINEFKNIKF